MSFATLPLWNPTQQVLYYLPGSPNNNAVIYANWPDGLPGPTADQQVKLIDRFEKDGIVRTTIDEIIEVLGADLLAHALTS